MKNITVTLDDETAAWTRLYAAGQNKSVSRFLGELLHQTMRESREYEEAMQCYLSKKPSCLSDTDTAYPARRNLYDRNDFR